jgi:choline dehydrogenase-like flavoprotein
MAGNQVFDAVVVGGGAAGCVVAARLAESGSRSVLLVEAGPDLRADTPDEIRDGWQITRDFDWGYTSEPNPRGDVQNLWRNKLVGGTSWVTRFAPRGSPADYDEWAALGNTGWGFEDVLPYFRRLETDADFGHESWHGDRGPMPVRRYLDLEYTELGAAGLRALEEVGFPSVEDHNRPGAVGAGRMPMTSRGGGRVTTADAYLPVGATPANLTIRPEMHVAEVGFEGNRATGVRLLDGEVIEASWVVLCAGVYGSPPILMRSGIGPPDHLRSVDVPVRVDLPGVGANLADHPTVGLDCGYRGQARTDPILHFIATFHSSTTPSDAAPDLMLWSSDPAGPAEGPASFEIEVVLLRPRSRGRVQLRSADPADSPHVELPALGDPFDVERLGEGYQRGLEVANNSQIRRHCADPPPAEPRGADELLELVRAEGYSLPHVVGTCAMGPRPEAGAVVNTSGQVHGTHGLSVVDASIMPDVPSGFTHLPTIMIAERLSKQIASLL